MFKVPHKPMATGAVAWHSPLPRRPPSPQAASCRQVPPSQTPTCIGPGGQSERATASAVPCPLKAEADQTSTYRSPNIMGSLRHWVQASWNHCLHRKHCSIRRYHLESQRGRVSQPRHLARRHLHGLSHHTPVPHPGERKGAHSYRALRPCWGEDQGAGIRCMV